MTTFAFTRPQEVMLTLQLECVSCKHYFSVDLPTSELELPTDNNRQRRRMPTQPIECPRCHADNRYWFRILRLPRYFNFTFMRRASPFLNKLINRSMQWIEQFTMASVALLITIVMMLGVIINHTNSDNSVHNISFPILTLLTGVLICFSMTGRWQEVREHQQLALYRHETKLLKMIPPHVLSGLFIFGLLVVVIPGLLHFAIPETSIIFHKLVNPTTQPTLNVRTQDMLKSINELGLNLNEAELDETDKETLTPLVNNVMAEMDTLAKLVADISDLDKGGIEIPDAIDTKPLRTWVKFLGLTGLIAFTLSYHAVNSHIRQVEPLLPPPVFVSVSTLSNLALEEIRNTLRLPMEELTHVEWMDAKRNASGGISLTGIRVMSRDGFNDPRHIRTYLVETDPWGRIQDIRTQNGH